MANHVHLTAAQKFALASWLDRERDRIAADCPTRDQLAGEASAALGFRVRPSNVTTQAGAVGLALPRRLVRRADDRLDRLEAELRDLAGRFARLAEWVAEIDPEGEPARGREVLTDGR